MPGYDWSSDDLITAVRLNDSNVRVASGTLTAGIQAAKIFAWQNTVVSGDILVWLILISITTASAAAATIDVGQSATDATSDDLIDGAALNATATKNSIVDAGTNGKGAQYVADDEYITGYEGNAAASTNLVGKYYIFYTKI